MSLLRPENSCYQSQYLGAPTAGVNLTYTPQYPRRAYVHGIRVVFGTSATVATRRIVIEVVHTAGTRLITSAAFTQTAGNSYEYWFWLDGSSQSDVPALDQYTQILPQGLYIDSAHSLRLRVVNIQAADIFGDCQAFILHDLNPAAS
jgi:hypothetical protein